MINPYQAPRETSHPNASPSVASPSGVREGIAAEFQLTARLIRYAESKFLLHRCGGRLTLVSLVMIALSILVAFDLPHFPTARGPQGRYYLSLLGRELAVMGIATVAYLSLIRTARNRLRFELEQHGVVADADLVATLSDRQIAWSGPTGKFEFPIAQAELLAAGKGALIRVDQDLFLFIPRKAEFFGTRYKDFVRGFKKTQRKA